MKPPTCAVCHRRHINTVGMPRNWFCTWCGHYHELSEAHTSQAR